MDNHKSVVFINTPVGTTHSVRDVPLSYSLADLMTKLELISGYPSNTYTLTYGKSPLLLEREAIFDIIQSGAVLKMVIKADLEDICRHVVCRDDEAILSECQDGEKLEIHKLFFAAYRCAFEGAHNLLKTILSKSPVNLLCSHTIQGRTLAHVTAVSDHPQVLQHILLESSRLNIHVLTQDHFSMTPIDVAKQYNAYLCERMIRNYKHHQRDGSLKALNDVRSDSQVSSGNSSSNKARAKSAVVKGSRNRITSAVSRDSLIRGGSRQSKLKRDVSFDTMTETSGYQTQENIPGLLTEESDKNNNDKINGEKERSASVFKPKKVKFRTRVKSAPPNVFNSTITHEDNKQDKRLSHNKCYQKKPFLAYRDVPFEELRPESVEFIALDSKNYIGMDAKSRERSVMNMLSNSGKVTPDTPYSSLNNSLQDIQDLNSTSDEDSFPVSQPDPKYEWYQSKGGFIQEDDPRRIMKENMAELRKRFTYPKTVTSKRAQSANYYCASYHIRVATEKMHEEIPPPRPKTAGPRYRAWKPWLLQLYKEQAANKKKEKQGEEKRKQNLQAFKTWLKKKQQEEEDNSSDSDDSEDDQYYSEGETYEQWIKRKKPVFDKMDKKKLEEKKKKKKHLVDRNVTIYELGSTSGTPMKKDSPDTYMWAYQKWQRRKKKYEFWKERQGQEKEDPSTYSKQDLNAMRKSLYCDGFTYNEWLGQLHREKGAQKKTVKFS